MRWAYAHPVGDQLMFADRSERGKLRFTAEQRAWFLHQILTQSFEDIAPGEARPAAFITAHGRMKAFMETLATDDAILMHFEPELRESLPAELARYVFATRVTIDDVTDELGLILIVGDEWRERAASCASGSPVHETLSLGVPGGYVWIPRSAVERTVASLRADGVEEVSEETLEAIRIRNRVPRWGRDMDEKTFPQEAGIDGIAVRYDKGCYLGQEAMAKIHFRGKPNRRLASLVAAEPLQPGTALTVGDQKVGSVTSVSGEGALALVRTTIEPGSQLDAGGVSATVAS